LSIDVHGTGAALRNAATELGAREAQDLTDHPQQGHLRFSVHLLDFAIHVEGIHARLLQLFDELKLASFCSVGFDLNF
jgi:hypothetical protein